MLFPLVYGLVMIMASTAISIISEDLMWLKYLLYVVAFIVYAIVVVAIEYKDGQEAVKIRHVNDIERVNIIKTGEDRPLNAAREYKPWKGFVNGLSPCIVLVILMIIQSICFLSNSEQPAMWAGTVASYLYIVVFAFFRPNVEAYTTMAQGLNYYYTLVAIPVFVLMMGIPYLLGARKQLGTYKAVEKKHNAIYGEQDCE